MKFNEGQYVILEPRYYDRFDRGKVFEIVKVCKNAKKKGYLCQWINEDCNVNRFFTEKQLREYKPIKIYRGKYETLN